MLSKIKYFFEKIFKASNKKLNKKESKELEEIVKDEAVKKFIKEFNLFIPKKSKISKNNLIKFKDPRIIALLDIIPLYENIDKHNIGDIVKLRNNAISEIVLINNKKRLRFISIEQILNSVELILHQRLENLTWPDIKDNNFGDKIIDIFKNLGLESKNNNNNKEDICNKKVEKLSLANYQKIVSTYVNYGPYRGLLVWHGLGSGKTCTSINLINDFILKEKYNNDIKENNIKKKIYVILPPVKSLNENFRSELSKKCPSFIKDEIEKKLEFSKIDPSNRIMNKYVEIISYVSLANKIKKNKNILENSLIILDEAHNLLYPLIQFKKKYDYLVNSIKKTKNIKIILLTATPIYNSMVDLTKLLNLLKIDEQLPENENDFREKYIKENNILDEYKFNNDIKGLISYYSVENDTSLFAKKIFKTKQISKLTEEHYDKWYKSFNNEMLSYNENISTDLINIMSKKFFNPLTGYLKKSSAMNNYPVLAYKKKKIWPEKFQLLLSNIINKEKVNTKHFIIPRHQASGSNAIGFFLEQQGWYRISDNSKDHGTSPPTNKISNIAKNLYKLETLYKTKQITFELYKNKRSELFKNFKGKPYESFVVYNNMSTQNNIKYGRNLFNSPENIHGKYIKLFIGDIKFSEGISLFNTTNIHIFEPFYSKQTEKQAIARVIRRCSHKDLDINNRKVNIYKYFSRKLLEDIEENYLTDDLIDKFAIKRQELLENIIDNSIKNSIDYKFNK